MSCAEVFCAVVLQSCFIDALLCDPGHERVDGADDDHDGARHQEDHGQTDNPGN